MRATPQHGGRDFTLRIALVCVMLALGAGCGRGDRGAPTHGRDAGDSASAPAAPSAVTGTDSMPPESFEGTAGIVDVSRPGSRVAVLRAVHTAEHPGFDRVVFEFEGDALPGYTLEYVDRPVRTCGSGEVVDLPGDAWLSVRLVPAQAHTDAGEPTVRDRERRVNLPVILELESTCDFEADVTWVLGVSSPNRYRALELTGPARLVVDVKH